MQKISISLWYDKEAKEAAEFYASIFPGAKITSTNVIHGSPSGDVDIVTMNIWMQEFTMISAGPLFKLNPSISFLVAIRVKEDVDTIVGKLAEGGKFLMELGTYPFAERYAWVQDKYGVSWQVMFFGDNPITQPITPTLMFVGDVCGKAEEAMNFYTSIFENSSIGNIMRYGKGQEPDKEGTVVHAGFKLAGQEFAAMDSAKKHEFQFNEAISLIVTCETQDEIDYYWNKLSAVPASEQCGWLKDQFGVSWQIVPVGFEKFMSGPNADKVMAVFMQMKKIEIAKLEEAAR